MNSIKQLTLSIVSIFTVANTYSQCTVNAFTSADTITCGSCASLSAFGSATGNVAFQEDFNSGSPTGWQFTQTTTIADNTCGQTSSDGSDFMWMGDAAVNPRDMTTVGFDLTLGGTICFEMAFAVQGDASPCEGPDEPDEGVYLQYSIDGGATWISINYFDPNGGNDPTLTTFNTYCFPIPAGAQTTNTMIQWHQDDVSGAEYDHWGIDNVVITLNDPNYEIVWTHDNYGYGLGNPGGDNPTDVCPLTNGSYTVEMSDGTNTCSSTVQITVEDPVIYVSAGNDTTICPGDCFDLSGDTYEIVSPAKTPTFSNNETGVITGNPMIPISVPCVNFSGCNCWDGSTVSIGNSCPAEPGDINATMNINVVGMNQTTVGNGFITSVCLNDFSITPGVGCTSTSLADIEVVLICPSGTEVTLVSLGSMTGNNVSNMCFELGAGAYTSSASPYSGTFAPASSWAALNGCNSNGVWSVEIRGANYETCLPLGSIEGWSITFDDPQITNPVNYVWSPTTDMTNSTSQTPNVCPSSDITYTLTSTDLNGCTSESADVTVTVGSCCVLDIDNVTVVQPTCGLNNGSITISTSGSITGLVYSIDGGATTQTSNVFSGLADGTYDIYVIDDAACPVTVSETLDPSSAPVIDNVSPTDPGCGVADGEIEITASGGVAPLTYSIDNGGTFQAGNIFTGLSDGTFDIIVEDALGCQVTGTATLNPSGNLTINSITIVDATCGASDGTITIDALGANASYTYSNDNGATTQASNLFSGLAGGTYDLVIDDGNGCVVDSTVTVNNPNAPTIDNVAIIDASCGASDGEITITATGGTAPLTFSIDNGTTQVAGNNFTGLGPATFDIVVEDGNSCVATTQAVVVQANAPIIDNITLVDPGCGAADGEIEITASGGTAPLSYSIDNGTTQVASNSFTGLSGATYDIVVEDATGCQVMSTEVLNPSGSISLTSIVLQNASCGASDGEIEINMAGATAAYTYSNDNGATSQASNTFTGLAGGSYSLVIDDGVGCTLDSIVSISNPSSPSIDNVSLTDPVCGAADGEITITATGGTAPLTYSIDNGTTQLVGNSFTGLTGATYDILVEDASGCVVTTTGTLATTTMPTITSITITDETCAGNDGTITIVGTDIVNYSIDNGASTQLNGDFNSLSTGNYTIVVDNGAGCTADSIIALGGGIGPVLDSVNTTNLQCFNAGDGEINIYAVGSGLTYSIDNGTTFQAFNQFSNLPQGSYDVVVENVNGCPVTLNVVLTEPADLTLATNTVDASCFGVCDGSIIALANGGTVSGAYDYNWSGGIAGASDAQAQNVCAGNYTLVVTDDNGCSISENLSIAEPAEVVINSAIATPEICPNDCNGTIAITGTNIINYSIDGGVTFQAVGDFTGLCPDDYNIVVEDANGCQIGLVESVDPAPGIDADFTVSPENASQLTAQFETMNFSNNATSYEWYTDLGHTSTEENPIFDFDPSTPAGDYTICLVASNLARCVDTTCNDITIMQDNFYYIPNSFTPNVDGNNDFFYVKGIGLENAEFELIIFDRWGELIYSFDSYQDTWDGTFRGSHVPDGTYIWKLTLKWEGELKPIDDIGHVNVLR